MKKIPIGIIGIGMVGSHLMRYFKEERGYRRGTDLFAYDKDPKKNLDDDVNNADVVFLCVPTPASWPGGSCDISALEAAVKMLEGNKIVVVKSTIPPGTTEYLQDAYSRHAFLFSPEFLTESRAWEDTVRPDRQIVGFTAVSRRYAARVLRLLPPAFFSSPGALGAYEHAQINATEAELGKYAANVFGALKVVYGNMLADISEATERRLGKKSSVAYRNVYAMLAHDGRIGSAWLDVDHKLYRGFGGACFPKDVRAFRARAVMLLRDMPQTDPMRPRFKKLVNLMDAMWEYNEALLASQGLTVEDVSVHDQEWVEQKCSSKQHVAAKEKII